MVAEAFVFICYQMINSCKVNIEYENLAFSWRISIIVENPNMFLNKFSL